MSTAIYKTTIFITLLAIFARCGSKQDAKPSAQEQPAIVKAVISVPTMKCDICAGTISDAVKTLDGVKDVKVDAEKKQATVEYLSVKLNQQLIANAIANAGYDANTTKRNETAFNALMPCCQVQRTANQ